MPSEPAPAEFRADKFDPDRICSVGTNGPPPANCTYRYDATGAVRSVQGAGSLFTYDGAGRVRSARLNGREAAMTYDPLGSLSDLRVSDGETERRESFFGAVSQVAFFNNAGDPIAVGPPGNVLQSFTDMAVNSPIGVVAAVRRSNTGARAILYPIGEAQGTRNVLEKTGRQRRTSPMTRTATFFPTRGMRRLSPSSHTSGTEGMYWRASDWSHWASVCSIIGQVVSYSEIR